LSLRLQMSWILNILKHLVISSCPIMSRTISTRENTQAIPQDPICKVHQSSFCDCWTVGLLDLLPFASFCVVLLLKRLLWVGLSLRKAFVSRWRLFRYSPHCCCCVTCEARWLAWWTCRGCARHTASCRSIRVYHMSTSKLLLQTGETGASALALIRIGARQWKVHLQPVMQVDQSDPSDLSGRKEPATTATWTPELRYVPGQEPKQ
jgi:hypothetical protein